MHNIVDWEALSKIKEIAVPLWLVIVVVILAIRGVFK